MKAKNILLGLVAAAILCRPGGLPAAARTQILAEPAEVQGMPCQGKVELGDDGRIKSCTLARDCTVAGFSLPAGTAVRFHENGAVESFVLGQQAVIEGFVLPAGSEMRVRRGMTCTLPRDTLIRGVPLPANSTLFLATPKAWESEVAHTWHCWLPKDTLIQGHLCGVVDDGCGDIFYPSGKLRAVDLAKDEEIDGVPCTSSHNPFSMGTRVLFYGLDVRAWFYENGRLAQGMVSRNCTIGGRKFKAGDIVRLTPAGTLDPAGTTLGSKSRGAGKRSPPESYLPDAGNTSGGGKTNPR